MALQKPKFVGLGEGFELKIPSLPKIPAKLRVLLVLLLIVVVGTVAAYSMFLEYVRPNEYGIKEVQIGVHKGIQEKVYGPGLAFVMPFGFQKIHRLPQNVQVLELAEVSGKGVRAAAYEGGSVYYDSAAKIQTSDGFYVDLDVTILYRIVDPYKVVTKLGPGTQFLHQGILPKAEPILKQALGELTTEEFYDSPLRVEKAELARELLDAEMQPKGIQVDQVLVRYFKYSAAIQQNIEDKKLQDQLVFTNQSKRKAAVEEQNLNRVSKEGEMQVTITLEEGEAYRVKKEAEKELYVRKKRAEADLLIQLAEAERTRLRNEAMQVLGADRLVAMRMTKVLEGLEVIVLPSGGQDSLNPLDLDSVLRTFGVGNYGRGVVKPVAHERPIRNAPPLPVVAPRPDTAPAGVSTETEVVQ